jgi:thiol-disulfide isomerase/thioredoxin
MEDPKRKKLLIVLFAVLIPAFMFQFIIRGGRAPKIPIDKTALFDEKGNKISISDNKGKVMIISYFQSWCGDCRRELPELEALQQAVGGDDKLKIFLISDEDWTKINTVKSSSKSNLTFYKSEKGLKEIGIRRFPTTYLINKKGEVAEAKVEGINWNTKEIQDEILKLNEE